jgi:putative redox protein
MTNASDHTTTVTVSGAATGMSHQVEVRQHHLIADEPFDLGGTDEGPNPYEYLLSALGACTALTIGMYARRKQWPLTHVSVKLTHRKIDATECSDCRTQEGKVDRITRDITLEGALTQEQREGLLSIANRCPVHRTLTGEISILSSLA